MRSQSTEDQLIDACEVLMRKYGFRRMSMEDVAKLAGVSRRTLYNCFANKEDLGLSTIGRGINKVFTELEALANGPAPVDERLIAVLRHRVLGRWERVQAFESSLDELFEVIRAGYLAKREQMFNKEKLLVKRILFEGENLGAFRSDSTMLAESMVLCTNVLIPYSFSPLEYKKEHEFQMQLENVLNMMKRSVEALPIDGQEMRAESSLYLTD